MSAKQGFTLGFFSAAVMAIGIWALGGRSVEFSGEPQPGTQWGCYVTEDKNLRCAPFDEILERLSQKPETKVETMSL
jgi:hypothetical protein